MMSKMMSSGVGGDQWGRRLRAVAARLQLITGRHKPERRADGRTRLGPAGASRARILARMAGSLWSCEPARASNYGPSSVPLTGPRSLARSLAR